jgi:hypothetical protein
MVFPNSKVIQDIAPIHAHMSPLTSPRHPPSNQNTCLHRRLCRHCQLSCRHQFHPTCLMSLCLPTRGAGRVQCAHRYVMGANDAEGPSIYGDVRHRSRGRIKIVVICECSCQWLFKYPISSLLRRCTTLDAPLRITLKKFISTSLPTKTTVELRSQLLTFWIPSSGSPNKT